MKRSILLLVCVLYSSTCFAQKLSVKVVAISDKDHIIQL